MSKEPLVDRKDEHLDVVLDPDRARTTAINGFDDYRFVHVALPELALDQIDLRAELLGKPLQAPLLISSMTGGASRAAVINRHLAEAAQALGVGLGVGSQRVALQAGQDSGLTRELRRLAPDIPLLANLGATQLLGAEPDWARRAVEMIEADGLIVHLNPLQEVIQREGDRDWRGVLAAIAQLVRTCGVPVVVKEVGAGISPAVARQLTEAGVAMLDVAGSGGTNWALVEAARGTTGSRALGQAFADWGIPTAEAVRTVHAALPTLPLIASGGVRHGVDAAKALRLGATLVAQAAAVLAPALDSTEAVVDHLGTVIEQLRIACFCTGSADLAALRIAPIIHQGKLLE